MDFEEKGILDFKALYRGIRLIEKDYDNGLKKYIRARFVSLVGVSEALRKNEFDLFCTSTNLVTRKKLLEFLGIREDGDLSEAYNIIKIQISDKSKELIRNVEETFLEDEQKKLYWIYLIEMMEQSFSSGEMIEREKIKRFIRWQLLSQEIERASFSLRYDFSKYDLNQFT